ncbi:ectonucleotide pyrophosphatase/phosphodiesterase [Fictibacillus nanhaiensis]|uniref:alkaline phosphatase family protein n=1 Tax=Fictibacillus nanhaiensis TaxID=742169 RepID=UPI001C956DD4|nr:ectonucleotide pyrophosphatase/phosphodiesterase [Fictibacillus nanhaiensis]MBY6036668.1 ectonucleotide pyrophosphatase/phosphodiesterase [Fictibacillus nanhaiensis]
MNKQTLLICIDGMGGHYLDDPKVKIPNLRSLISSGSVVSKLKTTYPSVTWTANTSAITGCHPSKHGVIGNSVYDRDKREVRHHWGDQLGSKECLVNVPTLYDVLAEKGGTTAAICWPLTREARNIRFNIPEFYEQRLFDQYATPDFWNELKEQFPVDQYAKWSADFSLGHMQDGLTKDIVNYVITNKQTDLIMAHFLLIDSMLHKHGNHSAEVYWAIEYVDQLVGEILVELEKSNQLASTDILIYSDHGHMDVHTNFYPNCFLNEKGLDTDFIAVSNDGALYLYRLVEDEWVSRNVEDMFQSLPFVKKVIPKDAFGAFGLPKTGSHTPELIVELKEGFVSKDDKDVEHFFGPSTYKSTHGYLADHPLLKGFMVGSGPSFSEGIEMEESHIIHVAPTLGALLGVELPDADGDVLSNLLQPATQLKGGEFLAKL